ncbi:MAG: response regulator [Vicinamibacterales bacterium]
MRILLCDVDASARAVTRRLLHVAADCDIDECASGPEAIERLARGDIDVLAIENVLPVLSGLETVGIIRGTPHLQDMPVLMITNDRTLDSVVRSKELQIADYILKPARMLRLQAALRSVSARIRTDRGPTPSSITIDQRTRAMVVDGDQGFREFLGGLLAPYCLVSSASSGAAALHDATTVQPSLVFVGRDLGPVNAPTLVRYMSRLGVSTFIKLASQDEIATERRAGVYAEVIARSLVPAVLLREVRRFLSHAGGPMERLLEHVPDIRNLIAKAAAATFSMMLSQDLDVVEPMDEALAGPTAVVTMTVAEAISARVEIQCEPALARQLAASALGEDAPGADACAGVLGEIANVVTGKIQAATVERGTRCVCGLPDTRQERRPEPILDDAERLVVELAPRGTTRGLRVVVDTHLMPAQQSEEAERLTA